jgi:alkylation response protein AidB-like acyl-CoA dehydrogenase
MAAPMARFEKIGCFGLTELLVGSGTAGGLTTTAKKEGDTWVLNGQKKWIGNATWCDISIIWMIAWQCTQYYYNKPACELQ